MADYTPGDAFSPASDTGSFRRGATSTPQLPGIPTEQKGDLYSDPEREKGAAALTDDQIVQILEGYRVEAEYARLAGPNSRDQIWLMNLDLYWNRFDYSKKAPWQAQEVMPELPQYVDRFAAAMRTALIAGRFFTVQVDSDDERDLADVVRKVMVAQLRRVGRSPSGHPVDFGTVFEDIVKLGALEMLAALVTYKPYTGGKGGYVCVEPVDAYNVWLDPTGRGLYRIRRIELDMHELRALAKQVDKKGIPLYKAEQIEQVTAAIVAMLRAEREKRTGTGQWLTSTRRPVVLHEYLCTIVDEEGNCQGENVMAVVANNRWLIRGPEVNPFWHQRDWLITAPIITVPLSPYGRSYVENFASLAKTFNELTNLILDGVFTSAMRAFAVVPSMLEDPAQIDEGIYPNVTFRLAEGMTPTDFIKEVQLGQFPPDVMAIWQGLKKEMQEGAAFNDISLGQLAPRSRTSATEIGAAEQNSNNLIKSIASNIEVLFLEPLLDVMWKTTIQHLSPQDKEIEDAVGPEWFQVLLKRKKEFAEYKISFICRGISSLIVKSQKVQALLQLLQIVGGNPILLQEFLQKIDVGKLIDLLMDLFDIEKDRLELTARERMMKQVTQMGQQLQQIQAGGQPGAPGGPMPPGANAARAPVAKPPMNMAGGQRVPVSGFAMPQAPAMGGIPNG